VNYFYKENYKPLKKEVVEDYRTWNNLSCSWICRMNIVKVVTTKSNLHVQFNSNQNPSGIHHRDWKIYPKICWNTKKTVNIQSNTEQEGKSWRYHNTWIQNILQNLSNKNSIILAQKQIWRSVEENKGPSYESMQLRPPNLTKVTETYDG
jgi:hypothetical protein